MPTEPSEIPQPEKGRMPDIKQVMSGTIQKLEQKNSELDGNLLVTFGQGERKALVFRRPITTEGKIVKHESKRVPTFIHDVPSLPTGPATFEEIPALHKYLTIVGDGFRVMEIKGESRESIDRALDQQVWAKTQDNKSGYIDGRMHLKVPVISYPPSAVGESLVRESLRPATPKEVEEIFRLNKGIAERQVSLKAESPSVRDTLSAASKIDELLK